MPSRKHKRAVEAMQAVSMARRSAVKAKTQAVNQLRELLVTASIRASLLRGSAFLYQL